MLAILNLIIKVLYKSITHMHAHTHTHTRTRTRTHTHALCSHWRRNSFASYYTIYTIFI